MARAEQAGGYHFSRGCDKPYTHTTRGDGFILTDRWRLQTIVAGRPQLLGDGTAPPSGRLSQASSPQVFPELPGFTD